MRLKLKQWEDFQQTVITFLKTSHHRNKKRICEGMSEVLQFSFWTSKFIFTKAGRTPISINYRSLNFEGNCNQHINDNSINTHLPKAFTIAVRISRHWNCRFGISEQINSCFRVVMKEYEDWGNELSTDNTLPARAIRPQIGTGTWHFTQLLFCILLGRKSNHKRWTQIFIQKQIQK